MAGLPLRLRRLLGSRPGGGEDPPAGPEGALPALQRRRPRLPARTAAAPRDSPTCCALSYTRDRLTGAERDIAARRGIGPQLREPLAAAVISALDGTNTGAACEVLTAGRDRAAAALNFELAARIHDELAALEWVTSMQRVTIEGGGDQDICGWADGLAVTFSIRGGRLNRWDQHECSRSAVAQASAATPPEWAAFAQRNAELAAALIRV
ncbi:hypothetical protein E1294_48825 [Nonomuraea diastatica]|uniref:UVR domain-containing protein n=1 Tax=Nonomuraea diastatica TaxID=1848329 RepID=A0A4R4VTH0_9ACTN|nr:hypothetical protein E1294_48825 [Nonomuraea diastatica]